MINKSNISFLTKVTDRIKRAVTFVTYGVWDRTDDKWYIRLIKILNLSVRSFWDRDLQTQAYALTYSTLLATVPVLAMLFAIARGFGFQNLLRNQIFHYFPVQKEALDQALTFVDNYLNQASEGWFVGIGIIVLLYTLICLIWNVENAFNLIWGIKEGRSIWRKITDYTAIFLILPLLMILASGINILMSSSLQEALPFKFISPLVSGALDFASLFLTWLFFVGAYLLIPNTKVPVKNAMNAGFLAAIGFMVLQWLFVSGTIYVSRYNAIYGSFAFLPLLLVWLQFVWVIVLSGAVICYSTQSIGLFSYLGKINKISVDYRLSVLFSVMAVVVKDFDEGEKPPTVVEISKDWGIPLALVDNSIRRLLDLGLVNRVLVDEKNSASGYTPAHNPDEITIGYVLRKLYENGQKGFIPGFDERFKSLTDSIRAIEGMTLTQADKINIKELIPTS